MDSAYISLIENEWDSWLLDNVVCPVDHCPLSREGNWLCSTINPSRKYPIAYGIPVLLRDDIEPTAWWARESLKRANAIADGRPDHDYYDCNDDEIHPHVRGILESTGGHLYAAVKQSIQDYPIPGIRVSRRSESQFLLDCGCNWGRWTFSSARCGIPSIGVDPSLGAVIAARQIRRRLGLPCSFVVADCRYLPFPSGTFSDVFSYSVVQHFSRDNARIAVQDFARVLQENGECLLQMPNLFGIRCLYHLARRGFRDGTDFDVRYYTPGQLRKLFADSFSRVSLSIDGFFGLGIQPDDRHIMPPINRLIIDTSECLRGLSRILPQLYYLADSLYIHGVASEMSTTSGLSVPT